MYVNRYPHIFFKCVPIISCACFSKTIQYTPWWQRAQHKSNSIRFIYCNRRHSRSSLFLSHLFCRSLFSDKVFFYYKFENSKRHAKFTTKKLIYLLFFAKCIRIAGANDNKRKREAEGREKNEKGIKWYWFNGMLRNFMFLWMCCELFFVVRFVQCRYS